MGSMPESEEILGQAAEESRQGSVATPGQPVELAAPGKGGESRPQTAGGVTVEVPFAADARPLAEDDQGDYLALSQGSLGPGARRRWGWRLQKSSAITYSTVRKVSVSNIASLSLDRLEADYRLPMPSLSIISPTIHTRRLSLTGKDGNDGNLHREDNFRFHTSVQRWTDDNP